MNTSKRTEQFKYAEKQKSTISNKSAKNVNNSVQANKYVLLHA